MPEILEKLFRSKAEIKFLRLFLNNPDKEYLSIEAAKKTKTNTATARKEINNLAKIKFLLARKKAGKIYYRANRDFIFYEELKKIIFKTSPTSSDKIKSQVLKLGQVRFLLISGIFVNSEKGKVDIMIVGEHLSKSKLKNFLSGIEAEAGKGVNYVCMSTDEFRYRKGMFDKFVINILESPHKVLIDRLKSI